MITEQHGIVENVVTTSMNAVNAINRIKLSYWKTCVIFLCLHI